MMILGEYGWNTYPEVPLVLEIMRMLSSWGLLDTYAEILESPEDSTGITLWILVSGVS